MTLSVAIITLNEESNLRRTLESVRWADEIVVVDSGSTDQTCAIAREFGAKVFVEEWKGFARQKNSAIDKCTSDWILSLDADEEVSTELGDEITRMFAVLSKIESELGAASKSSAASDSPDIIELDMAFQEKYDVALGGSASGFAVPRKNFFLGKWIRYGGFYPDRKTRLIRAGQGGFVERSVHETIQLKGAPGRLKSPLLHHAYPTLTDYIEHMNRYSSLGAEVASEKGPHGFSLINIVLRPLATFIYNYFFRLGFLDGKEGLLLHLYHSAYVSWKYAKAWERSRPAKL